MQGLHTTLELVTGLAIRDTDFTDDRLTIALRHLSCDTVWHEIERGLGNNLVRVYNLQKKTIRVDATTVSGHREGGDNSLWQFGHSKDDPALRQIKVMMASIDPLGYPIALDVVEGQRADDPLYLPVIKRVISHLEQKELLFVGDCKMSALSTRAYLQQVGQYYLTPLSQIGETAKCMPAWIRVGVEKGSDLRKVFFNDGEEKELIAEGYPRKKDMHLWGSELGRKSADRTFTSLCTETAECPRKAARQSKIRTSSIDSTDWTGQKADEERE